ncbi:hypothetical protein [Paraburkholderia ginsengisoli]|uniref:Uncharacterized protein n=1 Tax=Paraburkholderia ginsengisoli TaxID=311231 RepID=A0A7T4N375_9BURK|nr:hypothetical protein [Paraburkholderia ginsengisoli]QQC64334.1 hypothetical protein I6I06_02215 [Paraburkholderia ginsengisoli]
MKLLLTDWAQRVSIGVKRRSLYLRVLITQRQPSMLIGTAPARSQSGAAPYKISHWDGIYMAIFAVGTTAFYYWHTIASSYRTTSKLAHWKLLSMLKPNSIDALFKLLEEMTQARPSTEVGLRLGPQARGVERWTLRVYVFFVILLVVLVVIRRWWLPSSDVILHALSYVSGSFSVVSVFYLVVISASPVHALWRRRKQKIESIFPLLQKDLHGDAHYVMKLCRYSKPLLEYGLLQYRYRVGISESRAALLVGDIRKLGLFPALVGVSVAVQKLLESNSNPLLWMPVVLTGSFYLMAFQVAGTGERRSQVTELLQYAIDHAD